MNGGLGLAVEEVFGAELAWYAEFDPSASKIMAHHWPDLTNYGDVTRVQWAPPCSNGHIGEVIVIREGLHHDADAPTYYACKLCDFTLDVADRPAGVPYPVHVLSGGSPCQDLSTAGRRHGMAPGTRSGLWESMREAIATIQPTYVVWENVRGALSAKATSASDLEPREGLLGDRSGGHLRALGRVLGDLADLGYDCQWRGLRAADVGAPHGRFRVFILATRRGASVLHPRHGTGSPEQGHQLHPHDGPREPGQGTRGVAAAQNPDLPARHQRRLAAPGQAESGRTRADTCRRSGAPAPNAGRPAIGEHSGGSPAEEARQGAGDRSGDHRGERPVRDRRETPADASSNGRDEGWAEPEGQLGRPHAPLGSAPTDWGPYEPAISRWEAVRGTAPAPTELTAKGKHRLSPKLTEWMMGLPAGWVTDVPISRNDQLKACGNGVVPQQAAAALRHMLERNKP